MESHTFRSRLTELMQKSRKALRLYSSMGRMNPGESSELSDMQVAEWRATNSELLKQLSIALGNSSPRHLAADVCAIRDRFYTEWRSHQSELHSKQKTLLSCAESSDFIKAAVVSRELVVCKARMQASQAAYQELEDLLRQSKLAPAAIELSHDKVLEESAESEKPLGKVIPIRKRV